MFMWAQTCTVCSVSSPWDLVRFQEGGEGVGGWVGGGQADHHLYLYLLRVSWLCEVLCLWGGPELPSDSDSESGIKENNIWSSVTAYSNVFSFHQWIKYFSINTPVNLPPYTEQRHVLGNGIYKYRNNIETLSICSGLSFICLLTPVSSKHWSFRQILSNSSQSLVYG